MSDISTNNEDKKTVNENESYHSMDLNKSETENEPRPQPPTVSSAPLPQSEEKEVLSDSDDDNNDNDAEEKSNDNEATLDKFTPLKDDKNISKKIILKGTGWKEPNEFAKVQFDYHIYTMNDNQMATQEDYTKINNHLVVRQELLPDPFQQVLYSCLQSMKLNEQSYFQFNVNYLFNHPESNQTFKDNFFNNHPHLNKNNIMDQDNSNSLFEIKIKLNDFTNPKENWEMSNNEKIDRIAEYKENGNKLYKLNKVEKAMEYWDKGINFVSYEGDSWSHQEKINKNLQLLCIRNNKCMVLAKQNKWKLIINECNEASKYFNNLGDKNRIHQIKSLYRKGQALLNLDNLEDSKQSLRQAKELTLYEIDRLNNNNDSNNNNQKPQKAEEHKDSQDDSMKIEDKNNMDTVKDNEHKDDQDSTKSGAALNEKNNNDNNDNHNNVSGSKDANISSDKASLTSLLNLIEIENKKLRSREKELVEAERKVFGGFFNNKKFKLINDHPPVKSQKLNENDTVNKSHTDKNDKDKMKVEEHKEKELHDEEKKLNHSEEESKDKAHSAEEPNPDSNNLHSQMIQDTEAKEQDKDQADSMNAMNSEPAGSDAHPQDSTANSSNAMAVESL